MENKKLGILGGGQLGRMLLQAASNYNIEYKVLDSDQNAPCSVLTRDFIQGEITDYETVYNFGKDCGIITIEIENVNTQALKKLEAEGVKVFPQPMIIEIIKDKRLQKQFFVDNNIPTSDFIIVENKKQVRENKSFLPAVNKLAMGGYDGKGVQMIHSDEDLIKAFDKPGLLEKKVNIQKELAVIVARNEAGDVACFPVVEMVFNQEANLLKYLFAPASITKSQQEVSYRLAKKIVDKLQMVGVLAVELFLTNKEKILVNEIAPRSHNSGHHTIEANYTSQYDQHLRAILNMPLGNTETCFPAAIVNLIGEKKHHGDAYYKGLEKVMKMKGVYPHIYGKKTTKPDRKMGHITVIAKDLIEVKKKIEDVSKTVKVISKKIIK